MVIRTDSPRAERDWLDDLGPQAPNAFDSFVVRAPKITRLSTKTINKKEITSTPSTMFPQILPDVFKRRGQHTSDNERRLPPLPLIAKEQESGKTPVRAAIVCCDCNDCMTLRRVVSDVEPPQPRESTHPRVSWPSRDQTAAIALLHARSRRISLESSCKASAWHASRASGWGLVGWDKYHIAHFGMARDTIVTSGATRRLMARRNSST